MAVKNFNQNDLVGSALERLLGELEEICLHPTEDNIKILTDFTEKLEKIVSNSEISITRPDGRKVMTINGEKVDVTDVVKKIFGENTDSKKTGILGNLAKNDIKDQDTVDAIEAYKKGLVSNTIGIILNEDKILWGAVEKGITPEEMEAAMRADIEKSKVSIEAKKAKLKSNEEKMAKFGDTDYSETLKEYRSKSSLKTLEDDKAAYELMQTLPDLLDQLAKYKAVKVDKGSNIYKNNQKAMEDIIGNIKKITSSLSALDVRVGIPRFEKIDLSELEKIDKDSDFAAIKTNVDGYIYNFGNGYIPNDYSQIVGDIKSNFAAFGFKDENEADNYFIDAATVDAYIKDLKAEKDAIQQDIKFEENLQKENEKSIERYKEIYERAAEIAGKVEVKKTRVPVMETITDEDGKTVQRQKTIPKKNPDGSIAKGKDGNPIMEPVFEDRIEFVAKTDDVRKEILASSGISDEAAYRDAEKAKAEAEAEAEVEKIEAALTDEEKRDLIRATYKKESRGFFGFHFFKWFRSKVNPAKMWEKEGYSSKYLTAQKATAVADAASKAETKANSDLSKIVAQRAAEMQKEKGKLDAVMQGMQNLYKKEMISAASQEKMTDELLRGTSEADVKTGARDAAAIRTMRGLSAVEMSVETTAIYQDFLDKKITEAEHDAKLKELTDKFYKESEGRVKLDQKAVQDRAYSPNLEEQHKDRLKDTPKFKDEDRGER